MLKAEILVQAQLNAIDVVKLDTLLAIAQKRQEAAVPAEGVPMAEDFLAKLVTRAVE